MINNQYSPLICQIDDHHGCNIIGACLQKSCQQRRICCGACKYQYHADHTNEFCPLEGLYEWVESNNGMIQDLENFLKQIKGMTVCISKLINTIQQANQQLNFYQMDYTTFNNSINKLLNLYESERKVINFLSQILSNDNLKKLQDLCQFNQKNDIQAILNNYQYNLRTINQDKKIGQQNHSIQSQNKQFQEIFQPQFQSMNQLPQKYIQETQEFQQQKTNQQRNKQFSDMFISKKLIQFIQKQTEEKPEFQFQYINQQINKSKEMTRSQCLSINQITPKQNQETPRPKQQNTTLKKKKQSQEISRSEHNNIHQHTPKQLYETPGSKKYCNNQNKELYNISRISLQQNIEDDTHNNNYQILQHLRSISNQDQIKIRNFFSPRESTERKQTQNFGTQKRQDNVLRLKTDKDYLVYSKKYQ